ncbi:MAG: large conductance mechanosensitive channel protein MscL [Bacteroidota bacterium]
MGLASEFREFAMKGSVIDLAVGVVIGAAFGKIVDSMVNDIIMPVVGIVSGGKSFVDKFFAIDGGNYKTLEEARKAGGAVIAYGNFIQTTLNFLIIAFVLFMVIKAMNNIKRIEELKEEILAKKLNK